MDRPPETSVDFQALELRVLEGPQQGARAPLPRGIACVLAADSNRLATAQILLREDRLPPAAVRITAQDGRALVEVLHGEVQIEGQSHAAGAITPWAQHRPLQIGSAVVAFGLAGEANWPAAGEPASVAAVDRQPSCDDVSGADGDRSAASAPVRSAWYRRPETWLAGAGALVLLGCAVALQLTSSISGHVPSGSSFAATATAAPAAPQRKPPADLPADGALAREVAEVFRIQGVPVKAESAGPGHVLVKAQEADATKLARAQDSARRDVRGLERLEVANQPPQVPKPAVPLVDDPGKRIAALVPGAMAHVLTADGSRYFVGAQLPSGHRVADVSAQTLRLERDGQTSELRF